MRTVARPRAHQLENTREAGQVSCAHVPPLLFEADTPRIVGGVADRRILEEKAEAAFLLCGEDVSADAAERRRAASLGARARAGTRTLARLARLTVGCAWARVLSRNACSTRAHVHIWLHTEYKAPKKCSADCY